MKRVFAILFMSLMLPLAAQAEYRQINLTVFGMD